jgi:hypothetical protein
MRASTSASQACGSDVWISVNMTVARSPPRSERGEQPCLGAESDLWIILHMLGQDVEVHYRWLHRPGYLLSFSGIRPADSI